MCARVLVVDDDPVNLDLMAYLLTAFGHTPVSAESAKHGLQIVESGSLDLILCDIQMPGIDGFEFLRRLRPDVRKKSPVIGVTALAMVGDREKILAAGFDGYMAKPITPETFVHEVEQFLAISERGKPVPPSADVPLTTGSKPAAHQRKHVRILVVDNEPANLEILRIHLDHAGYDVVTARSGNAALELAQSASPDAIVSDVHMPDGDGFSLIRMLRTNPRLRDTPVIFVSATTQGRSDVERSKALGAFKFLVRPFDPEVLLDALTECLTAERGRR
jgi:CheY-like chemotaxis protein